MATRTRNQKPETRNLDLMYRWVQAVITHPEGAEAGIRSRKAARLVPVKPESLDSVIQPSRELSSLERIGIYSYAYISRLIECLEKDYEGVAYAVGSDCFSALARDYLARHPSRHYSLNLLGRKFPDFLRHEACQPHGQGHLADREFLAQLATLERTVEEVFDEEQAAPLKVDDVLDVPRDRWSTARFKTIPALRLLAFDYPVNSYLQAVYDKHPVKIPAALEGGSRQRKRRSRSHLVRGRVKGRRQGSTWLAVYRASNYKVWRSKLSREQYLLLSAIMAGKPLGAALEVCISEPGADRQRVMASVGAWFKEWAADGLFCSIEF